MKTKKAPRRPVVRSGLFETEGVSICTKCGCDDLHACPGGCSWITVDRERGTGVCSRCAKGKR